MAAITSIYSNWHQLFSNQKYSAQEFYNLVEMHVTALQIPDVKTSRVNLSEGGLFSSNREYLRITRKSFVFDICAAPFGTGFFVSWWLGGTTSFLQGLIAKIPFIGSYLAKKAQQKTYFQLDNENMFRESIAYCVKVAVDKMTEGKATRQPAFAN